MSSHDRSPTFIAPAANRRRPLTCSATDLSFKTHSKDMRTTAGGYATTILISRRGIMFAVGNAPKDAFNPKLRLLGRSFVPREAHAVWVPSTNAQ